MQVRIQRTWLAQRRRRTESKHGLSWQRWWSSPAATAVVAASGAAAVRRSARAGTLADQEKWGEAKQQKGEEEV